MTHSQLNHDEVLEIIDRLIQRSEDALEEAEDELRQVRSNLVALTIEEHILGPLSVDEEERKQAAAARFRELESQAETQTRRLQRLRAAREEWVEELPISLEGRFEELVSGT
jgi:hypothetical protein